MKILNSILRGIEDDAEGIWPILDIHMSRNEPRIRLKCLDIAMGVFMKEHININHFNAMLKHLDLILNDISGEDKFKKNRDIIIKIIQLLIAIRRRDELTKNQTQPRLIKVLEKIPAKQMDEEIIGEVIEAINSKHAFALDAKLLRDIAIKGFEKVYKGGVEEASDVVALKALYKVIATEGDQDISYKRKYIDIVAAGCQGLPPKGCNDAMFNLLKKTKLMVKENSEMCLLPLTQEVYDRNDSSRA